MAMRRTTHVLLITKYYTKINQKIRNLLVSVLMALFFVTHTYTTKLVLDDSLSQA